MSDVKKEKKAKQRATLAVAGRTGLDALMAIARDAPPAPSGADRLAKARAEREAKVRAALTREVVNVAYGLRQKGYGYALIANTITDVLGGDVKITAKVIKVVLEQVAAQQQQRPQQAAPAPQQAQRPAQPAQPPQQAAPQPRPAAPPAGQPPRQ